MRNIYIYIMTVTEYDDIQHYYILLFTRDDYWKP